MTPQELNETSDEVLFGVVDGATIAGGGARASARGLAPFITLELLRRVRLRVVELKERASTSAAKHKLLALAVLHITGVPVPPDERDVDKIGNNLELWWSRRYVGERKKIANRTREASARQQQLTELGLRCCIVNGWGGVQEHHIVYEDAAPANTGCSARRAPPYVPHTQPSSNCAVEVSILQLKAQVNEAQAVAQSAEEMLERERQRAASAKRRYTSAEGEAKAAKSLLEVSKKAKLDAERRALDTEMQAAEEQRAELERLQREMQEALADAEAKVHRLGGQAAARAQEAATHAQREEKARRDLELQKEKAEAEEERLTAELAALRKQQRQKAGKEVKALEELRAKVLCLEGHAGARAREAAQHAEREEKARRELEQLRENAEAEVERMRLEAAVLREEHRKAEKASRELVQTAEAKVLRLGSQAAARAQEAAQHAQREEEARRAEAEKQEALAELQEEEAYQRQRAETEASIRREHAKQVSVANAAKEAIKETSDKRMQKKRELQERVRELQDELEAAHEELEGLRAANDEHTDAVEKLKQMPTWKHVRKKGARGGGNQLEHSHRLAILEQHANGTPPSAIGRNITSVVKKVAPWLEPVEPTVRELRQIGFELPTLEEALSARKVAAAFRVRLVGFDETTDKQDPVITSNVQVQDMASSEIEDVVLKAAYLSTKGATSEAVASEIEEKCFARLRELLRLWKAYHKKMFPDDAWTGPDEEKCALARLAGGGALMSDTCNPARKTKRLLAEKIQKDAEAMLRKELGDEAWESLSAEEQAEKLCVYQLDCQQHLRNIWLGHMSRKQAQYVREELDSELQQFASWERMTTDYDQLLRAVYKEFHHGGRYYKGKGADFSSWLLEHYPDTFYMHIERADGGRQDLDYDAAVPIYANRRYLVEYLHSVVFACTHKNILEDFLYQTLLTSQFIMNWVLDIIDAAFQKVKDDGAALLDPKWEAFAAVAEKQPLFQEYLQYTFEHDVVLSPNGKVRHLHYKLVLQEALNPSDETNQRTHDKTVEYLQVQAAAALEKMYDPKLAIADKLTNQNGENSIGKRGAADKALGGCHSTNDKTAESVFGAWKHERRRNAGISVRRSSGLAQARISKSLAHASAIARRKARLGSTAKKLKRKKKSSMFGYFHLLPHSEQVALAEMCRAERHRQRALDHEDWAELHTFRAQTRRSNSELELEALIKNYALALSFYDRYVQRGIKSVAEIQPKLDALSSRQEQVDWMREQIEMRVIGLGWVEFKTPWSSSTDETVGTVSDLTSQLTDILLEEAERPVPEAAAAPIMRRKTFKQLGAPTAEAERLSEQRLSLSAEEMLAAAEKERARLEAAGVLDIVGDRQPKDPPKLDESLVGKKLEIHWRYWREARPGEKGKKKQVFIWCEGTVDAVSDGTIRKSKRSKDALPAGAVRIRWPADKDFDEKETLVWSILNPTDWCKEVHLGWRWVPCELQTCMASASAD